MVLRTVLAFIAFVPSVHAGLRVGLADRSYYAEVSKDSKPANRDQSSLPSPPLREWGLPGSRNEPLMRIWGKPSKGDVPALRASWGIGWTPFKALNYSQAHGLVASTPCSGDQVFDFGFYDGLDSSAYLQLGYCVVAVEADPDLVHEGLLKFAPFIASGQLRLVNVAVAPSGAVEQWTTFYKNKCTKEWNSFYKTVGCRSCVPPHTVSPDSCAEVPVRAANCIDLFSTFGVPHYLKLDIEGAETGCFEALSAKGPAYLPHFISSEVTDLDYIDSLHRLGYKGFKLVRQDQLMNASARASTSGPWGNSARDCRTAMAWRTHQEIRMEMQGILSRPGYNHTDPCPGGVHSIHSNGIEDMWYDVHATIDVQR